MGTRADYYVGRGEKAEWLGSTAWDGHPGGHASALADIREEAEFRRVVAAILARRKDATVPADGWPWPWEDSSTTDYAYAFDGGAVYLSCFGRQWQTFEEDRKRGDEERRREVDDAPPLPDLPEDAVFPNMKARARVTLGPRSGLLVFGGG